MTDTALGPHRTQARSSPGPHQAQARAQVRPACTFAEVSRFVDPQWLVEFEVDAVILD